MVKVYDFKFLVVLVFALSSLIISQGTSTHVRWEGCQSQNIQMGFSWQSNVTLQVGVYDINEAESRAIVDGSVAIGPMPYDRSSLTVWMMGGGFESIVCKLSHVNEEETLAWYRGELNQTTWYYWGGPSMYPYDYYFMNFTLDIPYPGINFTLNKERSSVSFQGSKLGILMDIWKTNKTEGINSLFTYYLDYPKVGFIAYFEREEIWALPMLLPIWLSYAFLGASFFLDPKKMLRNRLAVYMALFAFSIGFYFTVVSNAPRHTVYTIAEFLLFNLYIGISFTGIVSMMSCGLGLDKKRTIISDLLALVIAMLMFAYFWYILYFGATTAQASNALIISEIFGFVIGVIGCGTRLIREIQRRPQQPPFVSCCFYE